jgi:tetratricopeptide (TPR) repeat protein
VADSGRGAADEADPRGKWVVSNSIVGSTVNAQLLIMAGSVNGVPASLLQSHESIPRQLPGAEPVFTGRDEYLARALASLDPLNGADVSVIDGMAGVGKTQLAIQAGHAAVKRGWFPGGVIFLDLHGYDDSPRTGTAAVDWALRALGVTADEIPSDPEERVALYRSRLAACIGPVLIVADNARDVAQADPLRPGSGRHRLLVTSRGTLSQLGARVIELETLDKPGAVALLADFLCHADPLDARIEEDLAAAGSVALMCGYLPLALQIAAALLINDRGQSVAELAARLGDESKRLNLLDDQHRAVVPVFELSYRHLAPSQAQLFRFLAVNPGPDLATAAAAVLADADETDVRGILDDLAAAHIVERVTTTRGRWRMHDLLRVYARQLADKNAAADDREAALGRLLDYYLENAEAASDRLNDSSGEVMPGRFPASADAIGWLEAEHPNLVAMTICAREAGQQHAARTLAQHLVVFLAGRCHVNDLLVTVRAGSEAAHDLGATSDEAALLGVYSGALRMDRRFDEAEAACRQAVDISANAGEQAGQAQAFALLAGVLVDNRRFAEALAACGQAEDMLTGADDQLTEALVLNNHGLALIQLSRYEEALPLCRRAESIFRKVRSPLTALALSNLSVVLLNMEEYAEAISACRESISISRESGMQLIEVVALANMAIGLMEVGQGDEALVKAREALALSRHVGSRVREAESQCTLDKILYRAGRYEESLEAGGEAVRIFGELAARPEYAAASRSVGQTLRRLNRLAEAAHKFGEAAAAAREAGEHGLAGFALSSLGNALRDLHQYAGAATAYLQAASLLWEAGEESEADQVLDNLGKTIKKLGRFDPAEMVIATGGYPPARVVMTDLSVVLRWRGRFDEAASLCRQAIDDARTSGDRRAEGAATAQLSAVSLCLKRHAEAAESARAAIVIAQEAGSRRDEAVSWNRLGHSLAAAGRRDEATDAFRAAVESTADLDARYALAGSLANLGGHLTVAGDRDEAFDALTRAADLYHDTSRRREAEVAAGLAWWLLKEKRYDEAIQAADRAQKIFWARDQSLMTGFALRIKWLARLRRQLRRLIPASQGT